MPFIPHTPEEIDAMLETIGVTSIDGLFDEIDPSLITDWRDDAPRQSEMEMLADFAAWAEADSGGPCFLGAGCYDHFTPSAVWDLAQRGEFLTCYTPYQAEASQGTLQVIYEFQSMIAELTGLPAANASVYDGGSGLAEAVLMSVRANKKSRSRRVVVAGAVHPRYVQSAAMVAGLQDVVIESCGTDAAGRIDLAALEADLAADPAVAVVVQNPNFLGGLEDVGAVTDLAHANGALVIGVVNPIALAVLPPPGSWGNDGVDIAVGDGQPLGIPMASGGPSFGFMATRDRFVRQMPGRIVGRTIDRNERLGYTLTLQAREQHIRRGKATSNICTNQGLAVTAATIYMSLMGPAGLADVAARCHRNTRRLVEGLVARPAVHTLPGPFFHEAVIDLGQNAAGVAASLAADGWLAGLPLVQVEVPLPSELRREDALLVCATEQRTDAEIDGMIAAMHAALDRGIAA